MAESLRIVVDTNVFVSALLGGRTCRGIIDVIRKGKCTLLFSESLIKEINEVLSDREVGDITDIDVKRLFKAVHKHMEITKPSRALNICRDPGDNKLLEIAIEAKADVIISGDKDLLVLNPFRNIPILSPSEFILRYA